MAKISDILKTTYFWILFWLVTLGVFSSILIHKFIYILLGKDRFDLASHNWTCRWGKIILLLTPGWKVEIEGFENVPTEPEQRVVIVANHESMTDIWILCYLQIQFRWLSKAEVFKIPVIGQAMRLAGYIPIVRGDKKSHQEAMEASAKWIEKGIPMLFFPEGTRSKTSELRAFKMGAFKLARDTQANILPVALKGAGQLLPKGSIVPKKATVQVNILPLIPPPAPDCDLQDYADKVRTIIQDARDAMK